MILLGVHAHVRIPGGLGPEVAAFPFEVGHELDLLVGVGCDVRDGQLLLADEDVAAESARHALRLVDRLRADVPVDGVVRADRGGVLPAKVVLLPSLPPPVELA